MSGSEGGVPDDVLDGITGGGGSPTVNIEEAGGTEITIRKYLSRGEGGMEEVEEQVDGMDMESIREEVERDVEMRVEAAVEEAAEEPEPEPELEPEPEPEMETSEVDSGSDGDAPADSVDYDPSGMSGDDLTELTGIGESVEERLNEMGVESRADLADQFESGGDAIGAVPAMWKTEIADQLGVELPESAQPDDSGSDDEPEESGSSDGPVEIEAVQESLETPIPDVGEVEEIILLTTSGCPGCETAKDELEEHIESGAIDVLDIQESDRGADIAIEDGIQTTPTMVVIGEDGRAVF